MKARLIHLKNQFDNTAYAFRASYWFIPSIISVMAFLIALIIPEIDRRTPLNLHTIFGSFVTNPESARLLLSTLAGSTITIAGTMFTITITALVLASQQFGPRLIESFMRDRKNQTVLGGLVGIFIYCVVVIGSIRDVELIFIPQMTIAVAVICSMLAVLMVIFFIHHAASMIRVENVIERTGEDFDHLLKAAGNAVGFEPPQDAVLPIWLSKAVFYETGMAYQPSEEETEPFPVILMIPASNSGYIQNIFSDGMIEFLKEIRESIPESNPVLRVERYVGEYVLIGAPIMTLFTHKPLKNIQSIIHHAQQMIDIGHSRTVEQDIRFGFDKLVETAVRALSSAINDPVTAIMCLDRMMEGVLQASTIQFPSKFRYDGEGNLRVVYARPLSFEALVEGTFTPIRLYAAKDFVVTDHILKLIAMLIGQVDALEYLKILREQVGLLMEQIHLSKAPFLPEEINRLQKSYDRCLQCFQSRTQALNPQ